MVQLGREWAEAGYHVSILAADEHADGLLIRVGQAIGLERDLLEVGDPAARQALADYLDRFPNLALVDSDEEQATVEDVAGWIRARAAGGPAILLVDSLQTVRAAGTDDARDPRARVGAVMTALKAAARTGLLVGATCEVSRGAYGSRNPQDRIEDLAAFKESGGIEYGAHLALVLRSVADEVGLVDVTQPKNRWAHRGERPAFRLALNFATASFVETATPAAADTRLASASNQLDADLLRVRTALMENPGVTGKYALAAKLTGIGRTRAWAAVKALEESGEIETRGPKNRPRLYLRGPNYPELSQPSGIDGIATDHANYPDYPPPLGGIGSRDSCAGGLVVANEDTGSIPEESL
jgi:hypothetical protein